MTTVSWVNWEKRMETHNIQLRKKEVRRVQHTAREQLSQALSTGEIAAVPSRDVNQTRVPIIPDTYTSQIVMLYTGNQ